VSKAKTLKMKLVYVVAAVAMLAMLIPVAALPVSAQTTDAYLEMTIEDPILGGYSTSDYAYNIYGSVIKVVPVGLETGAEIYSWSIIDNNAGADFMTDPIVGPEAVAYITGGYGEATILAQVDVDGDDDPDDTISTTKKVGTNS